MDEKITIPIPAVLYQRLLSLKVDIASTCLTALEAAVGGRTVLTKEESKRGQGRPAPPVPKSKKSLYLDEQVWAALDAESKRQNPEEGISAVANRRLRESFNLDEK